MPGGAQAREVPAQQDEKKNQLQRLVKGEKKIDTEVDGRNDLGCHLVPAIHFWWIRLVSTRRLGIYPLQ